MQLRLVSTWNRQSGVFRHIRGCGAGVEVIDRGRDTRPTQGGSGRVADYAAHENGGAAVAGDSHERDMSRPVAVRLENAIVKGES